MSVLSRLSSAFRAENPRIDVYVGQPRDEKHITFLAYFITNGDRSMIEQGIL